VALLDSGTLKLKARACEADARPIHGGKPLHGPPLRPDTAEAAEAADAADAHHKSAAFAAPKKKPRVEAASAAAAASALPLALSAGFGPRQSSKPWAAHVKGLPPPPCRCQACQGYSRAALNALFKAHLKNNNNNDTPPPLISLKADVAVYEQGLVLVVRPYFLCSTLACHFGLC
jgi:hypothetical protein